MAQFGRALRSGRRGRKFESCRNDWLKALKQGEGQQSSNKVFADLSLRYFNRINIKGREPLLVIIKLFGMGMGFPTV